MATELSFEQLQSRYEAMTASAVCSCIFATELVGGQPASEEGVKGFVEHHLKLQGEEAEKAAHRILHEEVGEHDASFGGELNETKIYGVNVLRRSPWGPYLGDWQIKACIKQSASRVGVFRQNRGSKGDFAEAGRVTASGASLVDGMPNFIHLRGTDDSPAQTSFKEFMGRVQTPRGSASIIHHSECAPAGTRFDFCFRFRPDRVNEDDVKDILALAMIVGLGSVRSMERGKFRIEKCLIEFAKKDKKKGGEAIDIKTIVPTDGRGSYNVYDLGRWGTD